MVGPESLMITMRGLTYQVRGLFAKKAKSSLETPLFLPSQRTSPALLGCRGHFSWWIMAPHLHFQASFAAKRLRMSWARFRSCCSKVSFAWKHGRQINAAPCFCDSNAARVQTSSVRTGIHFCTSTSRHLWDCSHGLDKICTPVIADAVVRFPGCWS